MDHEKLTPTEEIVYKYDGQISLMNRVNVRPASVTVGGRIAIVGFNDKNGDYVLRVFLEDGMPDIEYCEIAFEEHFGKSGRQTYNELCIRTLASGAGIKDDSERYADFYGELANEIAWDARHFACVILDTQTLPVEDERSLTTAIWGSRANIPLKGHLGFFAPV